MFELRSHVDYFRKEGKAFQRYDAIVIGHEAKLGVEEHPKLHLAFIPSENELHLRDSNWQDAFIEAWSVPYADPSGHHWYAEHQEMPSAPVKPSSADLDAVAKEEEAKVLTEKPVLVKGVSPKGKK